MNRLTSKLNPTDATDDCHPDIFKSDSLKVPKLLFRFSLRAANSLATSIRQSLSVLCLWVLSIVRLLHLFCVIVERSHVFSLRAEEKDLSPAALVAGFTRRSLHRVMISVIIHFSASESCLILAKMSSKQVNSPSFINTLLSPAQPHGEYFEAVLSGTFGGRGRGKSKITSLCFCEVHHFSHG